MNAADQLIGPPIGYSPRDLSSEPQGAIATGMGHALRDPSNATRRGTIAVLLPEIGYAARSRSWRSAFLRPEQPELPAVEPLCTLCTEYELSYRAFRVCLGPRVGCGPAFGVESPVVAARPEEASCPRIPIKGLDQ